MRFLSDPLFSVIISTIAKQRRISLASRACGDEFNWLLLSSFRFRPPRLVDELKQVSSDVNSYVRVLLESDC